jgi:trehalose-6-phosphate synthase
VASKSNGKGVLILSEMAGSAKELVEAVSVNPNSIAEVRFKNITSSHKSLVTKNLR